MAPLFTIYRASAALEVEESVRGALDFRRITDRVASPLIASSYMHNYSYYMGKEGEEQYRHVIFVAKLCGT